MPFQICITESQVDVTVNAFEEFIVEAVVETRLVLNTMNVLFLCVEFHAPVLRPHFKLLEVTL